MPTERELNEETVKSRFLLKYLVDTLGIALSELDFEGSLSARLGRYSTDQPRQGRFDLLVKRRGNSLLLVEAKAEGAALSDDDRDQAISYARLLEQIAPLTLLTNCSDWRLFDTLTKQELHAGDVVPERHFRLALPADLLALREEALALFLAASPENILLFSRAQVAAGMEPLRGSTTDRTKKYVPELFVHRGSLVDDVHRFLSTTSELLAVLGDPGLGKTCSLCALAESLIAEGVPVLFYRGMTLPSLHLLQIVAEDFAWAFSEEETARNLIRRLGPLLRSRPLLVIVDAIDEWPYQGRVQDLLLVLKRLAGTNVKILLSCKTRVWSEFASSRGVPTGIENFLPGGAPYRLAPMTSDEFRACIGRYSAFYLVKAVFEDTALEAARANPFLLRILFEVAQGRGDEYLTFSSLRYFEVYYEKLLASLDRPPIADIIIRRVAQLLFEKNRERIRVFELASVLGMAELDAVLTELLQFRILESSRGDDGDEYVSFYFSLLRDFLVAFRVHQWNALPPSALLTVLESLSNTSVQLEALSFFYRYAEPSQQRLVDGSIFNRALEFTELYDAVLRSDLPVLRDRFPPFTENEIGFVGEFIISSRDVGMYGFRKLASGEPAVLLLPYAQYRSGSNLPYLYGAENLHAYSTFLSSDLRAEVLKHEIGPELRNIIDHGLLDESCCPELAAEVVAVEVARDRAIFSDARISRPTERVFPIEVARVRHWLRYELLYRHFERKLVDAKLQANEIPIQRSESGSISYSWSPTSEDLAWIAREVGLHVAGSDAELRELVQGAGPRRHVGTRDHDDLRKADQRVSAALDILEGAGVATIESHPFEQALELRRRIWPPARWPIAEACKFVEQVLTYALPIIQKMVVHNFPTLAEEFHTLWEPFVGVCAVNLDAEPVRQFATVFLCEPDPGQAQTRFLARDHRDVQRRIMRDPSFRFEICCDGVWRQRKFEGFIGQRSLHFSTLFHPRHDYLGTRPNGRLYGRAYPVVRAIVYDWIRMEIERAIARLYDKHGVTEVDREWTLFAQPKN